uniref:Uncharacterized protein n=1 Tax=Anguilla anguilla TaxID=7936 RepID=A0A0E9WL35_ANGAN
MQFFFCYLPLESTILRFYTRACNGGVGCSDRLGATDCTD